METFGTKIRAMSPSEQAIQISKTLTPGNYTSESPYPKNIPAAHVEIAKNVTRNKKFGSLTTFTLTQAGLHVLNPIGAQIVNPAIITGTIPGEGILGTAIDGNNEAQKRLREPSGASKSERQLSAVAGGTLGQEEGSTFFNTTANRTVAGLIDSGINVLAGALGIKNNNGDLVPLSPKNASFEKRLEQNKLHPNANTFFGQVSMTRSRDQYDVTYSGDEISGVKTSTIGEGFIPIQDGALISGDLNQDTMLRDNLERGYESNAPKDKRNRSYTFQNGLNLETDSEANASPINNDTIAPIVQPDGMIFPFYFESMNHFSLHPERFITFQATFSGLKEIYKPNWNENEFFGRSTKVYTYKSSDRTIDFSFIIWAPNRIALGLVKQRVNWLARHTYPSYTNIKNSSTKVIFEAPIIKFTIGDLFKNTPGVIQSLTFDWDNLKRWELSKDMIMPQAVHVSISITILHDRLMQNYGYSTSDKINSSDMYSYIKQKSDTLTILRKTKRIAGDPFAQLTEIESNTVVTAGN